MARALLPTVFAAAIAAAQTAPQTARIEGSVLSNKGEPILGASIFLTRMSGQNPPSPARMQPALGQGTFTFENVQPGDYTLSAVADGFVRQTYPGLGSHLTLAAGQELKGIQLRLSRAGSVTGRVLDPDGKPIEHAFVMLWRETWINGQREFRPPIIDEGTADAITAADGNYGFEGVRPGRYYVSAKIEGKNPNETEALVETLHPTATDVSSAVPLIQQEGTVSSGIDIRIRREGVYPVQGKAVESNTGKPAAGISIVLERVGGIPPVDHETTTREDGLFELNGVPSGDYFLVAHRPGEAATLGSQLVRVSRSGIDNALVMLGSRMTIQGSVRMEDGSPPPSTLNVALALDGDIDAGPKTAPGASSFELRDLAPARYSVQINGAPAGFYAKSIRFAGEEAAGGWIDLSNGPAQLDVVLSAKAAVVTGIANDKNGDPVSAAYITLWSRTDKSGTAVANARADSSGSFRFANLAPGEYYAVAWEQLLTDQMNQNPAFLARFTSDATAIRLEDSAQINIEVETMTQDRIAAEYANIP